jgi:transposase
MGQAAARVIHFSVEPTAASAQNDAGAAPAVSDPECPGCSVLRAEVAELRGLVAELQARLGRNSSNSSRPPSSDAPRSRLASPPDRSAGTSGRQPGGQPGHRGTTRDLKPFEALAELVECVPIHCAHCEAALPQHASEDDPHPRRHQVADLPPVVVETVEYRLHARTCPHCRQRTWANLPEGVPSGAHGPRLQAIGALLTGAYRLSRREARELLRDLFGEEVALGTISSLEASTATALSAPYRQVAAALAQAEAANVDETRWWEKHHLSWLWLAATPKLALFRLEAHRSREAFERLLPPPSPGQARTVTTDRYSAYAHLSGDQRATCWSHLKRDFTGWKDAGGAAAPLGKRALELTRQLFECWHALRDGEIGRALLCERLQPVQAAFRELFQQARASGHWAVAGPAGQLIKHWETLWTFARVEGVEPTNNHAERALRRAVLWRKGSFGHQSEQGRSFVERMLTAVTSLRLQRRNVLTYLETALRAALTGAAPPSLLPAAVA